MHQFPCNWPTHRERSTNHIRNILNPPPRTNTPSKNSRQRRIILLSMLTPPLRRNMLVGGNRPTLLISTDFKNHGGENAHADSADRSVSLPCNGCWPPTSRWGPNLRNIIPSATSHGCLVFACLSEKYLLRV